jgi:hypothetical protein
LKRKKIKDILGLNLKPILPLNPHLEKEDLQN